MVKTGKKLAAVLLTAAMILTIIPTSVYAANSENDKGNFEVDLRSDSVVKYHGGSYDTNAILRCLEIAEASGSINVEDEYYDLDKNGSFDFQLQPADTFTFTRLSGCSIPGDFTVALDQKEQDIFIQNNPSEYYYSSVTFEFPWEIDWLPGDISVEYGDLVLTYNGSEQKPDCTVKYYGKTLNEYIDYYTVGAESSVGKHYLDVFTMGNFVDKWCGHVEYQIKYENPLSLTGRTAAVRYSKLVKRSQTLAVTKVIKFKGDAKDKKTYTLLSAKKGSKSFKKYFKVNRTTGKVTVKKGLKRGTYKVRVKVKANGSDDYLSSEWKAVTFRIRVN